MTDAISPVAGTAGDDRLHGGNSDDVMSGRQGNDVITANTGNDLAHGGGASDWIEGGAGNDLLHGGGRPSLVDTTRLIIAEDHEGSLTPQRRGGPSEFPGDVSRRREGLD